MFRFVTHRFFLPMLLIAGGCASFSPRPTPPPPLVNEKVALSTHITTSTTTALAPASVVEVDFQGLIAHVVPDDGSATSRAVVLNDDGVHRHAFIIQIPPVNEPDSDLDIIGKNHPCDPNAGCTIDAIADGITLTIEGLTPALNKAGTFNMFVPSLSVAMDPIGNPIPATTLNPDLKNATPTAGGDFLAYFDYTGGTLGATPYCGHGAFKNNLGATRRFVDIVSLTGETSAAAATLKVTNGTTRTSKTFTFKDPSYIRILFRNMPINGAVMSDHFPLYQKLFMNGTVTLPEVDHRLGCTPKGTVVGCSDSQWP